MNFVQNEDGISLKGEKGRYLIQSYDTHHYTNRIFIKRESKYKEIKRLMTQRLHIDLVQLVGGMTSNSQTCAVKEIAWLMSPFKILLSLDRQRTNNHPKQGSQKVIHKHYR